MKLIVAEMEQEAFEEVRTELLDLGVFRITISQVHSTGPWMQTTLRHRGAPLSVSARSQLRLECVVDSGRAPCVVDTLRAHALARTGGQIAVIELDEVHGRDTQDRVSQRDSGASIGEYD